MMISTAMEQAAFFRYVLHFTPTNGTSHNILLLEPHRNFNKKMHTGQLFSIPIHVKFDGRQAY